MPGKIPDRWEDYSPMGTQIEGTRFITFKVPLKVSLMSGIPADQHFTPDILLKKIEEQGQQLGVIIDLTNTFRYYNPTCLKDTNTKHVKIKTEGHIVPSRKVQRQFFRAVDEFLEENSENEMLVGVHCTHGLNRTGYLVCRYMIDRLGIAPDRAIEAYNVARGHSIERINYLEDLRSASTPISTNDPDSEEEEGAAYHHGYGRRRGRGGYRQRQHDQRRQGNWDQGNWDQGGWDQQGGNARHQGGKKWQRGQGQWGNDQGQWGQNGDWNYWYQDQWEQNSWGSSSYNNGGYNNRSSGQWQSSKGRGRGQNRYKWDKDSSRHLSNGRPYDSNKS